MRPKKTIRCALSGRRTVAGWCEPGTIGAGTLLKEQPACRKRARRCIRELDTSRQLRCVGCACNGRRADDGKGWLQSSRERVGGSGVLLTGG
jgi:hypothetical protein